MKPILTNINEIRGFILNSLYSSDSASQHYFYVRSYDNNVV
jgi:hypothetical protein